MQNLILKIENTIENEVVEFVYSVGNSNGLHLEHIQAVLMELKNEALKKGFAELADLLFCISLNLGFLWRGYPQRLALHLKNLGKYLYGSN